jgi:hypothetical protein
MNWMRSRSLSSIVCQRPPNIRLWKEESTAFVRGAGLKRQAEWMSLPKEYTGDIGAQRKFSN